MEAVSRFGCKNAYDSAWFYTFPKPDTKFTLSTMEGCGPLAVLITNTTVFNLFIN